MSDAVLPLDGQDLLAELQREFEEIAALIARPVIREALRVRPVGAPIREAGEAPGASARP